MDDFFTIFLFLLFDSSFFFVHMNFLNTNKYFYLKEMGIIHFPKKRKNNGSKIKKIIKKESE